MTLQEAWYNIIGMDNSERMSSSQIFSILCDYGVFTTFPKLRIAVKTALNYGLWDLVVSKNTNVKISRLRTKLENDGFADGVIDDIIKTINFNSTIKPDCKTNVIESNRSNLAKGVNKRDKQVITFPWNKLVKSKDVGVTTLSSIDGSDNALNRKITIIPSLNSNYNIIFNQLQFSNEKGDEFLTCFEWEKRYWLKYNISFINQNNRQFQLCDCIDICIFVFCNCGRAHSKRRITSLSIKDKYTTSSGIFALDLDLPLNEIESIIIIPELEGSTYFPPQTSSTPPLTISMKGNVLKFIPIKCAIEYDTTSLSGLGKDMELLDMSIWGYNTTLSVSFFVNEKNNQMRKLFSDIRFTLALFDEKGTLLEAPWFFIEKTGFLYFNYFELGINIESIKKIVISQSN